ncbi:hypothetical protein GOL98_29430, partial [Streptomyces sp. Z38]|nr:hypothetical protein [Streptomyces sp. Z38]
MTQGQGEQRPPSAHGGGGDWQRDVLRELGGGASGGDRPGAEPRRGEPTLRLVHPAPPRPGTTAEADAGEDASAPHDASPPADAPHDAPAGHAPQAPAPRTGTAAAPDPGRPA